METVNSNKGWDLHGGANYEVMKMLLDIKDENNAELWVKSKIENGDRIMGMGHAVYKTVDPRSMVLKELSKKFAKIFVAEFNPVFGPNLEISVPNIKNFNRTKYHYSNLCWGVSLKALVNLMKTKGYVFLGVNQLKNNAFFVIDDFKNVAEQVQSYSKAFNLPATKRNNQIFDNIFEVTRDTSGLAFNPYVRTQCELKQDGFILFQGYLRLIDIQEKQGEISYNVNLYSEAIALADFLEDKTLSNFKKSL